MNGFELRAVGLTLLVPSAILLIMILLFRNRIQTAIEQRYRDRYGSKLFDVYVNIIEEIFRLRFRNFTNSGRPRILPAAFSFRYSA